MKRKKLLATVMIAIMVLGGCGNNTKEVTTDTNSETVNSPVEQETETVESSVEAEQEEETTAKSEDVDINSLIVEKTDEELDLKQYFYSYEDRTMDMGGERVFNEKLFEPIPDNFITTDNIDIYNINGIRVGYALKNVELETFGEYDGWYYFYLDSNQRFARVEDVKANSITREQAKAEEEANKQEEPTEKTEIPVGSTPVEQPVVETPPVNEAVESNKYTPDEAIAVYRSLMEAGGMVWSPEIKDVTSWGTGWIYLEKGQPEYTAESNLESAAIGGHGGNSWTKYYLEVTGFDDECVYITEWTSN